LPDDDAMSPPRLVAPHVPAILFDGMTADTKTVAHVTPAFVALTGLAPDEMIGRHWHFLDNTLPFLGEQAEPRGRADPATPVFSQERGTVFLRHRAETALLLLGETEHWLDVVVIEDASLETNLARSLQAASRAEEAAERTRHAVLRTVSHELRTPLNAIIGFAQLLQTPEDLDKRTIGEFATEIHSAGQDLLRIVERVIESARVQGGKVPIRSEEVDLAEIVRETTRRLRPVFDRANVRLIVDRLPPVRLRTDPTLARQVLIDILDNAVKFSPANGTISVNVTTTPEFGWVEVEDYGPGIPEEHRRRVFEPFEQGDSDTSRKHGGLGLGLHLALTTTGLLGGVLRHRNTGHGSLFRIGLPRVTPAHPAGDA
jgi:signal transduction histidine kinase